jgi:hypothetical protein
MYSASNGGGDLKSSQICLEKHQSSSSSKISNAVKTPKPRVIIMMQYEGSANSKQFYKKSPKRMITEHAE